MHSSQVVAGQLGGKHGYDHSNPARTGTTISHDARWITWHAPVDGVMNLWIAPRETPDRGRPLTTERGRGIIGHSWAHDDRHILYQQDAGGDENWQVFALDVETGATRALTATPDARFGIARLSRRHPCAILLTSNARDRRHQDLVRVDLATGEQECVQRNDGFAYFVHDDDFRVHAAVRTLPDGGSVICRPDGRGWVDWIALDATDARTSHPLYMSADGGTLYFADSRGREAAALTVIDLATDVQTVIAADPRAPVGVALADHDDYRPLAWSVTVAHTERHVLDESVRADFARFAGLGWRDWGVGSRSRDDRFWIVGTGSDQDSGSTRLYDRQDGAITRVAEVRPALRGATLSRMTLALNPEIDETGQIIAWTGAVMAEVHALKGATLNIGATHVGNTP